MRKSTFLLSLLLGLGGTAEMSAQAFIPQASVDGGTTYEYYVKCAGSNQKYWASTDIGSDNAMMFTENADNKLRVKLVDAGSGQYKIYGTNLSGDNTLLGCTGTVNESIVTWYATGNSSAPNASWTVAFATVVTTYGYRPAYTISPGTSSSGWNPFSNGTTNKLYNNSDGNSSWNFIPANLETLKKAAQDMQTELNRSDFDFAYNAGQKAATESVISTTLNLTEYSLDAATNLLSSYQTVYTAAKGTATLQSGYYKIVSKATDRFPYMFNDDFYASNGSKFTLTSQTEINTNNGIWKVTRGDGNTLEILNGQGQGISTQASSNGQNPAIQNVTTLTLDDTDTNNDGYYAFKDERLNCGDNTYGLGDYRALTRWVGGAVTANDNLWHFEPVSIADGTLYTVTETGESVEGAYVTYTHGGVTEHAYAGGFFVSETAPSASDFTVTAVGKIGTVTINGQNIVITYSDLTEPLTLAVEAAKEAIAKRGVGYPTTESEAYTNFAAAIASVDQAVEAGTATQQNLTTLQTATSAYKSTTDLAQLQTLEDGKAYRIYAKLFNGNTRLMYYDANVPTYYMAGATEYPNTNPTELASSILICRDLGNNQYAFVNNAGKYFIWRGGNGGSNNNRGFQNSYSDNNNAADLTLEKIVNADSQEALFGCLALKGKRNNSETANVYFVAKATSYGADENMLFDANNSSALIFEEVNYPNSVSLKSTEGSVEGAKYIATFSAPFATVIPEKVEAYYVGSAEEGKAQMTKIETEAIPANQGVILVTNDDATAAAPVTMVPATTEEAAEIAGANQLRHSAGAAKEMTDGNYILTNRDNEGVAFYPVTDGTTLDMNKSYLSTSMFGAAAFTLSFGGTTTGIDTVTGNAENANAPIYDLSGRRVQKAVKGGLYIQNGRKFIVK